MLVLSQINTLLVLLAMAMALLIVVTTLGFHRDSFQMRLCAILFLFPLILLTTQIIGNDSGDPVRILTGSHAVVSIGIFLIYFKNWQPYVNQRMQQVLFAAVIGIIALLANKFLLSGLTLFHVYLSFFVIICLGGIILRLRLKQSQNTMLIAALLLLAVAQGMSLLSVTTPWYGSIYLALVTISYLLFFLFFYTDSYASIMNEVITANKRLAELDRSINREVKKRTLEIERSNQRLLDIAKTDALTGVYNKINILSIINVLLNARNPKPFTILMFDIDNFKNINDNQGHVAGDMILKQLSSIAINCIRTIDHIGRYGGDEFIIVLPETSVEDARIIANRLRMNVDRSLDCTISIGIAAQPIDGNTARELITAADKGLYLSKAKGRNLVSYYREDIL